MAACHMVRPGSLASSYCGTSGWVGRPATGPAAWNGRTEPIREDRLAPIRVRAKSPPCVCPRRPEFNRVSRRSRRASLVRMMLAWPQDHVRDPV
jgi:hypothetical protein